MKLKIHKILMSLSVVALFGGGCTSLKYLSVDDPELLYQRALVMYEEEKWGKASRHFENIMFEYLGTNRSDTIMFYNSKCKFKNEDYYTAITYFEGYRQQFSRSPFLEDAEGMLTLSYYSISPGPERDPENTLKTLSSIAEFQSRYPNSEQSAKFEEMKGELIQRLHDRSYLSAFTYYKTGHYKSAIAAFRLALKEFPESNNREKIMYFMNLSAYELARNSIPSLEVDRYIALIDMYYTFISEFPESEYRKELDRLTERAKSFLEKRNVDENGEAFTVD